MPLEIYTDGSSYNKIRDGGYGWVAVRRDKAHDWDCPVDSWSHKSTDVIIAEGSGAKPQGTSSNNDMELAGIQHSLEWLRHNQEHAEGQRVILFTDSSYARKCLTEWVIGWRKTGWVTMTGEPIKNQRRIKWTFARLKQVRDAGVDLAIKNIKGHRHYWNEYADRLAGEARRRTSETNVPK